MRRLARRSRVFRDERGGRASQDDVVRARSSMPSYEGVQALKRVLYLLAAICFLGVGVCTVRFFNLPDEAERIAQSMQDRDSSVVDDGAPARVANAPADELQLVGGVCLVGGVVSVLLARLSWPTVDSRKN